jgi:hypothetical protein
MYFVGIVYVRVMKRDSGNVQNAIAPLVLMTTIGYICLHEEDDPESFPKNIRRKVFCKVLCTHFSPFLYFYLLF